MFKAAAEIELWDLSTLSGHRREGRRSIAEFAWHDRIWKRLLSLNIATF
jgi:hypothetical protein